VGEQSISLREDCGEPSLSVRDILREQSISLRETGNSRNAKSQHFVEVGLLERRIKELNHWIPGRVLEALEGREEDDG
jgi:hypothetical protein